MPINLGMLDEVSRDFAAYVAEHRPDWLAYARLLPISENSNLHHLEVEFPNQPGAEAQEPFWISTYGEEVTVGLDAHHAHFPWPKDYNGEDGRPAAMKYIHALMNEELVVVSFWDGTRIRCSSSEQPKNLSIYEEQPGGASELRIRSWRGSYNRTLRFDWDSYLKTIKGSPS
ncbi:hypothetical protein [Microvirga guangxiensis]|uniref:Uncharacterized protein n=1 Tax=Microvirga guangxiensis TaxID=549386 RepID=A0A1G5G0L4_9HYPH|nr:hypothetical protein [Microvirga guangxiensis]SCY44929.1 hypothetical protein SAMN02927923_01330 [Microvirga guangxiensis]